MKQKGKNCLCELLTTQCIGCLCLFAAKYLDMYITKIMNRIIRHAQRAKNCLVGVSRNPSSVSDVMHYKDTNYPVQGSPLRVTELLLEMVQYDWYHSYLISYDKIRSPE